MITNHTTNFKDKEFDIMNNNNKIYRNTIKMYSSKKSSLEETKLQYACSVKIDYDLLKHISYYDILWAIFHNISDIYKHSLNRYMHLDLMAGRFFAEAYKNENPEADAPFGIGSSIEFCDEYTQELICDNILCLLYDENSPFENEWTKVLLSLDEKDFLTAYDYISNIAKDLKVYLS